VCTPDIPEVWRLCTLLWVPHADAPMCLRQGRNSGNLVEELAAEFSAEGFSR